MPRRTPVKELQEEPTEGSLRRSSRIALGSPAPTKLAQRRNSTSDDAPAKTTKGRRLSLSQENNSESAENKTSLQTNAADTPKKLRSTRSCSKSPILLAKDLESRGTPARTRTRRGSKTLDEEDASSESSLHQVRTRSTRSESKSPTTVNNAEPARTRGRRGSITERVVPLEKIEESHPSPAEPKKRVRSRRSSLTEMSQLDVIKETEVKKDEIKKTDLETISEAKENDEKGVPDTPESKGKTASPGQEKDKFRMSPVVVIQKSKAIADLTTTQNSEKESITEVKETNDNITEAMNVNTNNDNGVEEKEAKNIDNQNSDLKKESKCVVEEKVKIAETTVASGTVELLTNVTKSDLKTENKSRTEENAKIEEEFPIVSNHLESIPSSDAAIKKIDHSPSEGEDKYITGIDTEMQEEVLSGSNNEKTLNPDFKKDDRSDAEENSMLKEKVTIISSNLERSTNSEKDNKVEKKVPIVSSTLKSSTSSDSSEKKTQISDFEKADQADLEMDKKIKNEVPTASSILEPCSDISENKTQTSDFKMDDKANIKMDEKIEDEVLIVSNILKPSTSSDRNEKETQISDFKKDDKFNTEENKKIEKELPIISNNLEASTSDSSKEETQNSDSKKGDKLITKQDNRAEEENPIIFNNQESPINCEGAKTKEDNIHNEENEQTKETSTHHTTDIKEETSSLDTVPINKMASDKKKLNLDEQCTLKKLAPEDEAILKNIDSVLNTDISEHDKAETSSENILNVSGEIDLEKIEADVLSYKSPNEIHQSTPENNQNTGKMSTQISDQESPTPAKKLDEKFCSNSNTLTSQEDLCNKSLSSLLPNQVEMTSGSDGSFNIKLSLQHVESFSSQENLSDCKQSKENLLNEPQDDLNKSDSSDKEYVKGVMPESKTVTEVNTFPADISLKEIEKTPEILRKQIDDSFSEPMDVDDPSLLHIDDILTVSKKRSSDSDDSLVISTKKILKSSKDHTSPMKKESASIIDTQEYSEKLKNSICNASESQLEISDVVEDKSEQTPKNTTDTMNLDLKENEPNKTDESNSNKTDANQATLEKGDVEQIDLNQPEANSNENTQETIQNISDVSHIVNESVGVDEEDKKRECLSPTFSINSADITDEDDTEDSPKKQTVVKLSADLKTTLLENRDDNKESENSIATLEEAGVEKQIVEGSISEVMVDPVIEGNSIDDTNASTQEHSDKTYDEKQIEASLVEETENSTVKGPQNTTLEESENLMDAGPEIADDLDTPQNKSEVIHKADDDELSKEVKVPSRKSLEERGTNDKRTDQVSSTTSNETKSDFETGKIPESIDNAESNVDNTFILEDSSNENVRKDLFHNGGEGFQMESDKDHVSKKDAKSNILSAKDKDSDDDQLEDTAEKSPSQQRAKLAKSKSKKISKASTNGPVEMDHSAEENIKKDEPLKKKRKKKKGKSTPESSFDERVENFIEETLKELSSSSEDENNIDEESNNVFIDDMAEEGEEDTPSEGSNDIPCDGESINSSDTYTEDDDDDSYEADSFIDDDDDKVDLLSGEENFLQDEQPMEKAKTKKKSISPPKQKKKRQRIIRVSISDDEATNQNEEEKKEDVTNSKETTKDAQIESKSLKEETKEDSSINLYPFHSTKTEMDIDTPTDILPSKNDVIHVDSESSNESEVSNTVEQIELNKDTNGPTTESRSNRKSSITIQENIKLEDIEDGELSDRISKVVDWFYTGIRNNSDTGNISLNVSLDYADLPPDETSATVDVEVNSEKKDTSCDRQSKKRKSDDFIENESPKKEIFDEISGDENNKECDRLVKPKLLKKSKRKSLKEENQEDEVFSQEFTSESPKKTMFAEESSDEDNKEYDKLLKPKLVKKSKRKSLKEKNQEDDVFSQEFTSEESKLVSVKTRKKRSHKFAAVEDLNENESEPDSKRSSKRLNDDKSNYILPKRAKRGTNKVDKSSTQDHSTIIKDITSTINKKESIENDFSEEFIENNVIETDIMRNKNKKIKKNKKVKQVSDDIGNVITKKKKTKKVKEVVFANEDNTNLDNDFHPVSSKRVNKHIPFTRKMSELNEFNVEVENEKKKKMKRLSYSTKDKKTEIPCSSGILKQQFTSNTTASMSEIVQKQERRRRPKHKASQKLLPSKNIDVDGSWESEIFDMSIHPSKSNRKHIDAGTSKKKKTEIDSFSSKDFKNRMLYDSSRIKRMATKVLLRQRKGF